jgi:hypothetical protein
VHCLIAIYNCVTEALNRNENFNTEIWKIPAASRYQSFFNPYQQQYDQRLLHQLSSPRVVAIQEKTHKSFTDQKLEDAAYFLEADIERYKVLNMNYAKNTNPSSKEDLLNMQELILLDIRFLAGCDIHWDNGASPQQTSSSAAVDAAAKQQPLAKQRTMPPAKGSNCEQAKPP